VLDTLGMILSPLCPPCRVQLHVLAELSIQFNGTTDDEGQPNLNLRQTVVISTRNHNFPPKLGGDCNVSFGHIAKDVIFVMGWRGINTQI
jgi:hypothetical protein